MPPKKQVDANATDAPGSGSAGAPPFSQPTTTTSITTGTTQVSKPSPCGTIGALTFPPLESELIPDNIRIMADATHVHALRQAGVPEAGERLLSSFRRGQLDPGREAANLICRHCARSPEWVPEEEVEDVMDDLFGDGEIDDQLAELAAAAPLHEQALMIKSGAVPTAVRHTMVHALRSLAQTLSARGGSGPCFVINAEGTRVIELLKIMATPEVSGFVGGTRTGDVLGVVAELSGVPAEEARALAHRGAAARSVFLTLASFAEGGMLGRNPDPLAGSTSGNKKAAAPLTDNDLAALHEPLCDWQGTLDSHSATLTTVRSFTDGEAERGRKRLAASGLARIGSSFGD